MHGKKQKVTRADGRAEVDGYDLVWTVASEPVDSDGGGKGLRMQVQLAEGAHRELIIEFPFDRNAFLPQRPKITREILEAEIRTALADGWNPESRGRALVVLTTTELEPGHRPGQAAFRARMATRQQR